jgi:hypothetical protein
MESEPSASTRRDRQDDPETIGKEANVSLQDDAKSAQAARFRFLQLLYEKTGGQVLNVGNWHEIANELGIGSEIHGILLFLSQEGLIEPWSGGFLVLTHAGVKEVEAALTRPSEPTRYFPPVNTIVVRNMVNSQISQSSPGAVQSSVFDLAKLPAVMEVVSSVRSRAPDMGLSKPLQDELLAEATTIEVQAASPKPKPEIVTAALASLKTILESAAGSLAARYAAKLAGLM